MIVNVWKKESGTNSAKSEWSAGLLWRGWMRLHLHFEAAGVDGGGKLRNATREASEQSPRWRFTKCRPQITRGALRYGFRRWRYRIVHHLFSKDTNEVNFRKCNVICGSGLELKLHSVKATDGPGFVTNEETLRVRGAVRNSKPLSNKLKAIEDQFINGFKNVDIHFIFCIITMSFHTLSTSLNFFQSSA